MAFGIYSHNNERKKKLINIVKPSVVLPPISQSKAKLPLFGKRNRLPRDFGIKKIPETAKSKKDEKEFEIEEDDDDHGMEHTSSSKIPDKKAVESINKFKTDEIAQKVKEVSKIDMSKDPVESNESKKDPEQLKSTSKDPVSIKSNSESTTKLESISKDPIEKKSSVKEKDPVQKIEEANPNETSKLKEPEQQHKSNNEEDNNQI